jgi:CRISPR-associated protein Cmr6
MRQAIVNLADGRERATHPGLILQRYLVKQSDRSERRAIFETACHAAGSESLRSIYAEAFERQDRLFASDKACRSERLSTASRLIVGLGSETILETGLRLHHTYGVPIIPGSALKGLAAHYCHDVWGQRQNVSAPEENLLFRRGGKHHSLLFGTTEDGGVVALHDAWLLPESLTDSALCLDVMTPHHPKWQMNEAPPTDFDSPVPVSFLSVAGTFDVRLSWSGPASASQDQAEAWTKLAMQLLREALAEWGVGGKTNSGYGRLVPASSVATNHQSPPTTAAKPKALPKPGEKVDAQLLEERTRKNGWKAMHAPSGLSGPIQNSSDVPSDKKAGDMLGLIVASATERGIDFRYPTSTDEARAQRLSGKGKGGRGRPQRR